MLEIRSLKKVYRPRKGVPVTALEDVSLTFGDRGMVFLLGKSGSGKSTLLNLLGGLDRFDGGELIIKGVSSANFRQRDFDSYRNTYVGFIFQEYNLLEEFTVGANIALAIELQGRKATDEQINAILEQVDLAGYGDRKPNELSGGQKQRVAIARALVKNPEIIMADEPTGALDSETGRQVLETLKKLSADKLVLVVSHDREFAERYGDRIVELADGRVIRDVERTGEPLPAGGELAFEEDGIHIPPRYRLTEADREAINAYLEAHEQGTVLRPVTEGAFAPTDPARIPRDTGSTFRLIKSRLPMKNAMKIGASSLKHKKFRLAVTLILSVVAFTLFGLSDTFGSYNHIRACTDSLQDSHITYASVTLQEREKGDYWNGRDLSEADIRAFSEKAGLGFTGVYRPDWLANSTLETQFDSQNGFRREEKYDESRLYATAFFGFADLTEKTLEEFDFSLEAGRLPEAGKNEIAISRFVYETFEKAGYRAKEDDKFQPIASPGEMVGKTLTVGGETYTVCGIVNTRYDRERYASLAEGAGDGEFNADLVLKYALATEMEMEQRYSLCCMAFVAGGETARMAANPPYYQLDAYLEFHTQDYAASFGAWSVNRLGAIPAGEIQWFSEAKTTLGEKEILVNPNSCYFQKEDPISSVEDWQEALSGEFSRVIQTQEGSEAEAGWTVVGLYQPAGAVDACEAVLSDADFDRFVTGSDRYFQHAVAPMPSGRALSELVEICYDRGGDVQYHLNNPPCFELDALNELFKMLSQVFFWLGLFFAGFSGLLLANFIATSITYKKQEIGILRAIGSRSADVFRIFFSESFFIAAFNAVAACLLTALTTFWINGACRAEGLQVTVLHFGVRQVLLMIAVSLAVAAVASFFPVRRIASKRPIDAIRNK